MAMRADSDRELRQALIRADGQEDVCLATYSPSTSRSAGDTTACIRSVVVPEDGERRVHGNASFTGAWIVRVGQVAAERGEGLVLLHSHPQARLWQQMSQTDEDTESGYAGLITKLTGLPMIGMTLAGGNATWSARFWSGRGARQPAASVRVVGDRLAQSFNPELLPPPPSTRRQIRTVSAWGDATQADFARTRVLVVGLGSVGLDVALRLAASGICTIGLMDFDEVEVKNLDRMIGATRLDARLGRSKVEVAARLMRAQSTAKNVDIREHEVSISTPEGLDMALGYDVIVSAVDRPWARAVLNSIAYADLIPVIDGGISIENNEDGRMRSATARVHTLVPGQPCMTCSRQISIDRVLLDKEGLLDNEDYVRAAGIEPGTAGQNVATLAAMVSAEILAQFVSLIAAPGGKGVPGPLRYNYKHHVMELLSTRRVAQCPWEATPGEGDQRVPLVGPHPAATEMIQRRHRRRRTWQYRVRDIADRALNRLRG